MSDSDSDSDSDLVSYFILLFLFLLIIVFSAIFCAVNYPVMKKLEKEKDFLKTLHFDIKKKINFKISEYNQSREKLNIIINDTAKRYLLGDVGRIFVDFNSKMNDYSNLDGLFKALLEKKSDENLYNSVIAEIKHLERYKMKIYQYIHAKERAKYKFEFDKNGNLIV